MASEVIELGSSDDEAEPALKKSKPLPNAMVHIPNKLPGITIKPAKSSVRVLPNGYIGKTVTISKMSNLVNPYANKMKTNGKTQKTLIKQVLKPPPRPRIIPNNALLNPVHLKMPIVQTINKSPGNLSKNALKIHGAGCLSNLPATITVKRTKTVPKRVAPYTVSNVRKKVKVSKEVLTVDLVDDDTETTSGPQWYMRPEEQSESSKLEEQNNAEPGNSKLVEIIIEDSPVKPVKIKKTGERTELSITIDDSPAKTIVNKSVHPSSCDEENTPTEKVPHSKKKLEYPISEHNDKHCIEIEVQIMNTEVCKNDVKNTGLIQQSSIVDDIIVEIEESPVKSSEPMQHSTPKKKYPVKPYLNNAEFEITNQSKDNDGEFHPVYQSFIDLCFELENSDDMKKIVEKKIKAYYRQVAKEYTESEDFIDMVSSKIFSMKAGPEKMYLYIKDIVDELNFRRKLPKSQAMSEDVKNPETEQHLYGEDIEYDSKRQRQIRRLEKTLKKLHRAIQKLEEQEVDFDDEEDSVYLLTERYKERLVRVHAKFCQLTNTKMPSEPRVPIDPRPGQPKGPAKQVEKLINKKVPIGKPLPFPDFHDVLRCVRDANEEDELGWNEADIMEEARDLFTRCGKKLQRRRQENDWRLAASRISAEIDPADGNEELKNKLYQNMQMATKKETDVFNKFADRQNLLKLEGEEIGDKEADESPVESEDEEANPEDASLETTEKRKERLKRLLHEKSKKLSDGKISKLEITQFICSDEKQSLDNTDPKLKNNVNKENEVDEINKINEVNKEDEETYTKINEINNDIIDNETTEVEVNLSESVQKKNISNKDDNVQPVSDDSNKIESDIDELHLLQKLHSENEINTSTIDSSDTDTQIAISDTYDSSSDNKMLPSDDVFSIENSSYSEGEVIIEKPDSAETEPGDNVSKNMIEVEVNINTEIKSTAIHTDNVLNKSNNDEYNDSVENILLASSEEDDDVNNKDLIIEKDGACVNLKDDSISIGETIIEGRNDTMSVDNLDEALTDKNHETLVSVTNTMENLLKEQPNDQESDSSQVKDTGEDHAVMEINEKTNEHGLNEEHVKLVE